MITAANAPFLDAAIVEGGTAVAAAGVQQAGPAGAIAEQDQILSSTLRRFGIAPAAAAVATGNQ